MSSLCIQGILCGGCSGIGSSRVGRFLCIGGSGGVGGFLCVGGGGIGSSRVGRFLCVGGGNRVGCLLRISGGDRVGCFLHVGGSGSIGCLLGSRRSRSGIGSAGGVGVLCAGEIIGELDSRRRTLCVGCTLRILRTLCVLRQLQRIANLCLLGSRTGGIGGIGGLLSRNRCLLDYGLRLLGSHRCLLIDHRCLLGGSRGHIHIRRCGGSGWCLEDDGVGGSTTGSSTRRD